ncbi:o-succinylbenzoate synthase [Mangrovimonas aestuarii]|uniref:o-succinylbenzoate synthase n=1 Tax=Mangrovimonas aestuarii TaxID=3018443 RepID=UPI002377DB69|nr:o-succinylbenzoate synthase [Mangrovimonas aestuarii]
MIYATNHQYILNFKQPGGTSRGVLNTKETWFLCLEGEDRFGIGEIGLFRGLSADDRPDFEQTLNWVCNNINWGLDNLLEELGDFPSIRFGLEMAFKSYYSDDVFELYPSNFTKGAEQIPINGLIWMGDETFMQKQIESRIAAGFNCIKMKIGAIDFITELNLLKSIRESFTKNDIELRVDANGAFDTDEAMKKLEALAKFDLHSIEQPIKAGQHDAMAKLCEQTPLPIALDEELIGISAVTKKQELIQTINPQYIILKPSLVGGFKSSKEWIDIAEQNNCGWWITSALESNVGLNAIAQWTYTLNNKMPQGLGTGSLFTNNFDSPLTVENGGLKYDKTRNWTLEL